MEGFIAKAGQLTLTTSAVQFMFRKHDDKGEISIPLSEIDKVDFFKTLSIIPNGVTLFLRNGDVNHFVVDDRNAWMNAIASAKEQNTTGV